jgi:hypothetical protein
MDGRAAGILVIVVGLVIVLLGLMILGGWLGWFGRLPGDIRIERENVRVYVPLASMLIVSIALTLLLALFRRWL